MAADGKQFKTLSIPANRLKLVGETYDFSTATALRGPTPLVATDVANKSYVESVVNGLNWQAPVEVMYYVGTRTIAQIDALTPTAGWSVVSGDAGTPAAGTSDALVAGDVAEFGGTSWYKIVTNAGGFPPVGTRAVIAWPAAAVLYAPLTDGTDEGKIANFDGTSLTPSSKVTAADGWAILCKGSETNPPSAYNEGKAFSYLANGGPPAGSWNQVSALIPYGSVVAVGSATSDGASSNVARADHVHDTPLPSNANKFEVPAVSAGVDAFDTTLTIAATPALDTYVAVDVNGVMEEVGNGVTTKVFYYSDDAGATAKTWANITAADGLFFNPTVAGYDTSATDKISQHYLVF